jgi:hypothetical protein
VDNLYNLSSNVAFFHYEANRNLHLANKHKRFALKSYYKHQHSLSLIKKEIALEQLHSFVLLNRIELPTAQECDATKA